MVSRPVVDGTGAGHPHARRQDSSGVFRGEAGHRFSAVTDFGNSPDFLDVCFLRAAEKRFYPDRIARGHCHHRDFGGDAAAGFVGGQTEGVDD